MDPLATLLYSIDERLGKIDGISVMINSVLSTVSSLTDKLVTLEERYNSLHSGLVDLAGRVSHLEACDKDRVAVKSMLGNMTEDRSRCSQPVPIRDVTDLEIRTLQLEIQALSDQLVLTGLPELPNEDLVQIVRSLGEVLKVPVKPSDLVSVKRLGKGKTDSGPSEARDIAVKFGSPRLPCEFISGKKYIKDLRAGRIDARLSESPVHLNCC